MPIVRLDDVSLSFGLRPLLDHIALQIRKGERVCLLGRNGEGKSSLLQVIARQIAPDGGEVWIRPGVRVASLAQEVSAASDDSVLAMIKQGIREGAAEGEWQRDLQVNQIISRLQLDRDASLRALSGGWRRRVMLARALVSAPDLLLLDEPTNHLDIEAITWLEDMMIDFEGAVLFVSHDRAFVRRLATRIVELDRGQLREWSGNYDDYVLQKLAALEVEAKHAALFDKKLAQEEAWIRQGVEARRTRNEGRVRALKQLRRERSERRDRIGQVEFKVQDAAPSGKLVFEARHARFDYGAAPIVADFSARIMRGDRIGIMGPNGCGKTTLIKLLMGELQPTSGTIRARYLAAACLLRPTARTTRCRRLHHGQCHGRQRRYGHARRTCAARVELLARFPLPAGTLACAGEHVVGRRTQSIVAGEAVRETEQSAGDGRTDQ